MNDNPFQLLNLPENFDINLDALEQNYLKAQQAYHPDKWVSAPSNARRLAASKAADINAAYRLLKNPVARARYFLEEEGLLNKGEETISDPELLEEIFELQENKPNTDQIRLMAADIEEQLIKAFDANKLDQVRYLTLKLGYILKLQQH